MILMNVFFFFSSFHRILNPILLDLRCKKVLIVLLLDFQFEVFTKLRKRKYCCFLKKYCSSVWELSFALYIVMIAYPSSSAISSHLVFCSFTLKNGRYNMTYLVRNNFLNEVRLFTPYTTYNYTGGDCLRNKAKITQNLNSIQFI
jgi:hypothetical protein